MDAHADQTRRTRSERQAAVLIVEDDTMVESLLVSGLDDAGIDVRSIPYGYQCQRAIEQLGEPAVVVVDAVLPCTNGAELGAELDASCDDTTVIVINTDRQPSNACLRGTDVVTRPRVDPVSLVDSISERL